MMSPNIASLICKIKQQEQASTYDKTNSLYTRIFRNKVLLHKFIGENRKRKSLSLKCKVSLSIVIIILNLLFESGTAYAARSQLPFPYANPHHCFVCLPDDKNSNTAKDIQKIFPGTELQDCSSFDPNSENAQDEYLFKLSCPMGYKGCLLRSAGTEVARTCTPIKYDECKLVNSIELCYCPHSGCNRNKSTLKLGSRVIEERRTSRHHVHQDFTDDEDLGNWDTVEGSGLSSLDSSSRDQSNYNPTEEDTNLSTSHDGEADDSSEKGAREMKDIQDNNEQMQNVNESDDENRNNISNSKSSSAMNNLGYPQLVTILISLFTLVNYYKL